MFTGIVEEVGTVRAISRGTRSCVLTISAHKVLKDAKIGDSICTSGVCLTVTSLGTTYFTADVMSETLKRSALGRLGNGSPVNLERAMPANGRFGGHFVSGHIDGTGTVSEVKQDDNAVWYKISASPKILQYIVEKGSIAIDGISLTVALVDDSSFSVSVIPHTREVTSLGSKTAGSEVNLECDVIGKYIEKLLALQKAESGITEAFLLENGF